MVSQMNKERAPSFLRWTLPVSLLPFYTLHTGLSGAPSLVLHYKFRPSLEEYLHQTQWAMAFMSVSGALKLLDFSDLLR